MVVRNGFGALRRACGAGALLALGVYALYRLLAYSGYVTNFGLIDDPFAYISNLPFMLGAAAGKLVTCAVVLGCYLTGRLAPRGLGVRVPLILIGGAYALAALVPPDAALEAPAAAALGLFWGLAVTVVGLAAIEPFVDEPSPVTVIVQLAACALLLAAGSYALALLPPRGISVAGVVMAAALGLLFRRERRRARGEDGKKCAAQGEGVAEGPRERRRRLRATLGECATPILAASFFELVVGLVNMYAFTSCTGFTISTQAPLEGSLVCAVIVIAFVAATARIPQARFVYLVVFPTAIAVFLALPYFGDLWGKPLSTVIYAASAITTMLTTFCIIRAARRTGDVVYGVAAIGAGAMRLCLVVGLVLGWRFGTLAEGGAFLHLSIACVVCVYLLGMVVLWWGFQSSRRKPAVEVVEVVVERPAPTFEESVSERVEELVRTFGLSPRERDVLVGLAQGNTAASIAEGLHISTSTAQGYIKSLYVKLGVNKKQQVIDLFQS